jgi:proteasome lid subunit RPN8/RPN11
MHKISFGEILDLPLPAEILPDDSSYSPPPSDSILRIYVLEHVIDQINQQALADYSLESGGILIGHPFYNISNPKQKFVIITDCVQTHSDNKSGTHFTVMPEELIKARDRTENEFPGLIVVGWYHSHPGLGVFLSSQDMQIVKSIYNADWHVAYVIDHIKKQHGFFYGSKGIAASDISYLKKRPPCIEAILRYNIATSSALAGDPSELEVFRKWLLEDRSKELSHWRITKTYQELQLDAQNNLDAGNVESTDINYEAETKKNKSKTEKFIQLAEYYLKTGPAYLVLPQIEQILRLSLDAETSARLSKILQDLNKKL